MSTPGFSAELSLRRGRYSYTHGAPAVYAGAGGEISPQFLDWIKEGFESLGSGLSTAADVAASAISSALSELGNGGGRNPSFQCSPFVSAFLSCGPNGPAVSAAQITQQCVTRAMEVPEFLPLCVGLGASIWQLSNEFCKNPTQDPSPYIQKACSGLS
jgi:hypothetical protein